MSPQSTANQQLIILVGGNGSGKSTYFQKFLSPLGIPFVNADLVARERFGSEAETRSREAAEIVEDLRYRFIKSKKSFCFETVFSHPSKVDFLAHAKANTFKIKMIAIYTSDHSLNVARVAQRVDAGGHSVPEHKIRERIPRTHKHIEMALPLCDEFVLLDNSLAHRPFLLRLAFARGVCRFKHTELPTFAQKWAKDDSN